MEPAIPVGAGSPADSRGERATPRVLLAEDHAETAEYVTRLLRQAGLEVETASDGLEVERRVAQRHYDLIVMDVEMPLQDGLQTTRLIRSGTAHSDVPIIALTAHAMDGDRERCLAAGMDDYIQKPLRRADILRVIETWAGRRHRTPSTPAAAPTPAPSLSDAVDIWPPRQLLAPFLTAAEAHLASMERAAGERDELAVRAEAHALEGAAAIARTSRIQRGARMVGHSARNQDWDQVLSALARLRAECDLLRGLREGGLQVAAG